MPNMQNALSMILLAFLARVAYYMFGRKSIAYLRGPPNPSWLVGTLFDGKYDLWHLILHQVMFMICGIRRTLEPWNASGLTSMAMRYGQRDATAYVSLNC
jgi:hypothetical protein